MSSALLSSRLVLRSGRRGRLPSFCQQQQHVRHKHQVRVIVTRDLPDGQMRGVYAGEVHDVAAGYARNYLVPEKYAVYATPRNFERCGLVDTAKEDAAAAAMLSSLVDDDVEGNEDLRAADLLRRYLRNKSIRIVRNVDPNMPVMCHPGHVEANNLREKLSRQLKIDLEDHERIHIRNEPVVGLDEKGEAELMQLLEEMDLGGGGVIPAKKVGEGVAAGEGGGGTDAEADPASGGIVAEGVDVVGGDDAKDCDAKVKQLGDYVAKITLRGGYVVPLKFSVVRR
jgi:ribosomal protein L9